MFLCSPHTPFIDCEIDDHLEYGDFTSKSVFEPLCLTTPYCVGFWRQLRKADKESDKKGSPGTLVSGDIRFVQIFTGEGHWTTFW